MAATFFRSATSQKTKDSPAYFLFVLLLLLLFPLALLPFPLTIHDTLRAHAFLQSRQIRKTSEPAPPGKAKMSVNITIPVSLYTVGGILDTTDPSKMTDALATLTKAAVTEVKALPAKVKDTAVALEKGEAGAEETDTLSLLSFDSNAPAPAPAPASQSFKQDSTEPPANKVNRKRSESESTQRFPITIKTLTGKSLNLLARSSTTVNTLKYAMWGKEGIEPAQQRLLYQEKPLYDGCTLAEVNDDGHQGPRFA